MGALLIALFVLSVFVAVFAVIAFRDAPKLTARHVAWVGIPVLVTIVCAVAYRAIGGTAPEQQAVVPSAPEATSAPAGIGASPGTTSAAALAEAATSGAPVTTPTGAASASPVQALTAPAAGAPDGKALFASNCAACHQLTGAGVPGAFPPLAGSEIPNGPASKHIDFVLNGHTGALTVQGKPYNGSMPAFKGRLKAAEIAAIITYERTSWGNHGSTVTEAQVKDAGG